MIRTKIIGSINKGNEYLYILEHFSKYNRSLIYVARDDREIFDIKSILKWYFPSIDIHIFRSWNQIPYDNVSPSNEIQSERIKTLYNLLNSKKPLILITSVNAIIQKTLNYDFINNNILEVYNSKIINFSNFINKISLFGYQRTSLVREKSEFAVRGSIIDIFLIDRKNPIRLDFFDNKIESISEFDHLTQKSITKLYNKIIINPSNELLIQSTLLKNFRNNFRKIFSNYRQSEIYNLFSQSIIPPGGENYIALFYDSLLNIFDYCENFHVILNADYENLINNRIENINDFYNARLEIQENFHLHPKYYYLSKKDLNQSLLNFKIYHLNEFNLKNSYNLKLKKINNISSFMKEIDFNFIKKFIEINKNKTIIIFARSEGSLKRIINIFLRNLQINLIEIENFDKAQKKENIYISKLKLDESIKYENYIFLNEKTLFGYNIPTSRHKSVNKEFFLEEINKFTKNSILVHSEYGFCKFIDVIKVNINESFHDCLKLEFANKQNLLLPIENLNFISKYGDDETKNFKLDHLGAAHWQKRKANAKNKIKDIAKKLMVIAAKRHNSKSYKIKYDPILYEKFCSTFPFVETDDQIKVLDEVKSDFSKSVPSDRLIVGDVAFGKTEIIIRATFLASISKIQSLILVPTTLLSRQHYINFSQRLSSFGIIVKELSRFIKTTEKNKIYEEISEGRVDIIIGTHALLNKKINFKKLGLIIYDEEQKLGTNQKEIFKNKSPRAHVISLSATPIPRTLSLSLSGIRDLSLISTAPYERLAVRCFISPFDKTTIIEAIKREIYGRKNSVFYVTPRRKDLPFIENFIKEKLPDIDYVIAHGKLKSEVLEERIKKFYNKEIPLLISTNIIENGLDLTHVNTIIINRSNIFSLASLYQLKGRVGRSNKRGYAYLTYFQKELTDNGRKRLNIINSFDEIGSGFNIASQDLNLRGSGSIIGEEQSGFIKEVGVELYHQMLEEEILFQKKSKLEKEKTNTYMNSNFIPTINIPEEIYIPENYINDADLKVSIYKRISQISSNLENNNLMLELIDRFGNLPNSVKNLFKLIEIKILCLKFNIIKLDFGRKGILISFYKNIPHNRNKLMKFIELNQRKVSIKKDGTIFYDFLGELNNDKFILIKKLLNDISQ